MITSVIETVALVPFSSPCLRGMPGLHWHNSSVHLTIHHHYKHYHLKSFTWIHKFSSIKPCKQVTNTDNLKAPHITNKLTRSHCFLISFVLSTKHIILTNNIHHYQYKPNPCLYDALWHNMNMILIKDANNS